MNLVFPILVIVFVLAIVTRAAAWAARLGVAALVVLLVLFAGVAVWRLSAVPGPVRVAFSAEKTPVVIPVAAKKPAKASPAPAAKVKAEAEESEDSAIPLEAEPGKTKMPPRPAWVDGQPAKQGDVYRVPISSGPQEKLGECGPALDQALSKAVAAYIDEYFGTRKAGRVQPSDVIGYDLSYIRQHLVKPGHTFEEKLQMSFGPMYQTHALLEFGPAFRKELDGRRGELERCVRETAMAYRLRGLGLGFGAVLCLLAVVFGYFRLDTATRGYYTGRLQFLATAAILGVIVAGAVLASRLL